MTLSSHNDFTLHLRVSCLNLAFLLDFRFWSDFRILLFYLFSRWFQDDNQPKLVRRAYNADGNASDRWVAEFETEGQMDKAFDIKENLMGRTIRLQFSLLFLTAFFLFFQN